MNVKPRKDQFKLQSNVVHAFSHQSEERFLIVTWSATSSHNMLTTELMLNRHRQNQQFEKASRLAARLTRLLEVLPGGVIVLDGEGLIQQNNSVAIELLGEPLEGQRWSQVIKRAFSPQLNDGHDVSLKDGRLLHISTNP
ncbi:MAG: PAS domain-containing protein [Gammaproteobacteria bacterium]|nr:PAS domain-containing protein [Gammaproteobacteria bacterium]